MHVITKTKERKAIAKRVKDLAPSHSAPSIDASDNVDLVVKTKHLTRPKPNHTRRATNFFITTSLESVPELGNNRLMLISYLSKLFPDYKTCFCAMTIHDDTALKHFAIALHFKNARTIEEVARYLGIDVQYIWIWRGYAGNMFSYLCHRTTTSLAYKEKFSYDRVWSNHPDFAGYMHEIELKVKKNHKKVFDDIDAFTLGECTELELLDKIGIVAYDRYYYRIARAKRTMREAKHQRFLDSMKGEPTHIVFMDNIHDDFADDPNYDYAVSMHIDDGDTFDSVKLRLAYRAAEVHGRQAFSMLPSFGYGNGYDGEQVIVVDCKKIAQAKNTRAKRRLIDIINEMLAVRTKHNFRIISNRHNMYLNCEVLVLINASYLFDELDLGFAFNLENIEQFPYKPELGFSYYGFKDDYANLDSKLDAYQTMRTKKSNKKDLARRTKAKSDDSD